MKAKSRLGKGIDALFPAVLNEPGSQLIELSLDEIRPNPIQPRKTMDQAKLGELAESIKLHGLLSPIIVRRTNTKYEIIAGERRFHACMKVGVDRVPVIVREVPDDESFKLSLIENLQREDLNPMEEAEAFYTLKEQFSLTHQEIAESVVKDRSTVTNALRLISLPEEMKTSLREGTITPGHARALLMVDSEKDRLSLFQKILSQSLSVRETERRAVKTKNAPAAARKKDPSLEKLSGLLSDRFSAKVVCSWSKRKGKITIEVSSKDELKRIIDELTRSGSPF
ncbi:MAG: ParB/RepB/Spo0J family partition protein [Deltaproteobacteria bacterium]|nr:ParB/RepB/Spo0J family partition protein [Deltaproteobacteria bacterium]